MAKERVDELKDVKKTDFIRPNYIISSYHDEHIQFLKDLKQNLRILSPSSQTLQERLKSSIGHFTGYDIKSPKSIEHIIDNALYRAYLSKKGVVILEKDVFDYTSQPYNLNTNLSRALLLISKETETTTEDYTPLTHLCMEYVGITDEKRSLSFLTDQRGRFGAKEETRKKAMNLLKEYQKSLSWKSKVVPMLALSAAYHDLFSTFGSMESELKDYNIKQNIQEIDINEQICGQKKGKVITRRKYWSERYYHAVQGKNKKLFYDTMTMQPIQSPPKNATLDLGL